MVAGTRRFALVVAGALILFAAGACSDDSTPVASGGSTTSAPAGSSQLAMKVPGGVTDLAGRISAARQAGTADLSGLSTAFVHVRADGKIELVVRSAEPISVDRQAELQGLGFDVVGKIDEGTIQGWMPDDKVDDVATLSWVRTIAPAHYPRVGA